MLALPSRLPAIVAALASLLTAPSAYASWKHSESKDAFTDERVSTAHVSQKNGIHDYTVVVRCRGKKLEAYVDFDDYLGDDSRPVRYRVDREESRSEKWWPSADGTAVFARQEAEFARALMHGAQLAVEAQDFRGVRHQTTFSLAGSMRAIAAVLDACNVASVSAHQSIPNVRREVALNIERWGPLQTITTKQALREPGYYSGPIDTHKNEELYIAVTKLYDFYISQCKSGESLGTNCDVMQTFWKANSDPVMPMAGTMVYELAPEPYKSKLGKLYMGD